MRGRLADEETPCDSIYTATPAIWRTYVPNDFDVDRGDDSPLVGIVSSVSRAFAELWGWESRKVQAIKSSAFCLETGTEGGESWL